MFFRDSIRRTWIAGLALALAIGAVAHAEDGKQPPATQPYPLTTCVVSGEKLGGDMGEPKIIQFEGREVRFCCPDCEKDFRKDPQKYLKKLDEATKAAATQPATTQPVATVYVCPMHADVKADKPGKCPQCGMELQAQKPQPKDSADASHAHEGHTSHQ